MGAEALARFAPATRPSAGRLVRRGGFAGVGVELELAALSLALEGLDRLPSGIYLSVNASAETMMTAEFRGGHGQRCPPRGSCSS